MQEVETLRRALRFLLLLLESFFAVIPCGKALLVDISLVFDGGIRAVEEQKLILRTQQREIVVLSMDVYEVCA